MKRRVGKENARAGEFKVYEERNEGGGGRSCRKGKNSYIPVLDLH